MLSTSVLCGAGKVKDLYQAVAKALNLPAGDPQKLLLLAEYDSRQTLTMHSQGSEPLTTVSVTNGPGYFHSSKPLLLAYCYPSAAQGPASGKQLLVYHRSCSWTYIPTCCQLYPPSLASLVFESFIYMFMLCMLYSHCAYVVS